MQSRELFLRAHQPQDSQGFLEVILNLKLLSTLWESRMPLSNKISLLPFVSNSPPHSNTPKVLAQTT